MIALVDGTLTSSLPVDDPLLVGGLGVYEALRTYRGRPFAVDAHFERLHESARWCGLRCPDPVTFAAELDAVAEAVPGESTLLVTLTPGGHRVVQGRRFDASRVGRPVRLATFAFEAPAALPGWVKHTSRGAWEAASRRAGVDELLFVGADGTWTETSRSNLWVVRGGVLCTPAAGGRILAGVTRATLLAIAEALGLRVREAPVLPGPADELYVSSTLKELAPVAAIDGVPGPGWGPVGRVLAAALPVHAAGDPPSG